MGMHAARMAAFWIVAVAVAATAAPVPAAAVGFPRTAPPLPEPAGDVVRVATVAELLAAADALKSGQTILVAPGVYAMPHRLPIQNADDVTVRGAGGDRSQVVLDFAGSKDNEGVVFTNCKRPLLADLTVQNVTQNGIKLNGHMGATHVTVRNVHSRNVWQRHVKASQIRPGSDGTQAWAPGHRVEFCLFENDRPKRPGDEPFEDENPGKFRHNYVGGIDVMSTDGLVVADNVFRNIHGNTNEGRGCVFIWMGSKNAVVERNLFIDCDQGVCLGNPSRGDEGLVHATDCVVRNNFVVRCPENDLFAANTKGCRFVHNTVLDPDSRMKRLFRAVAANEALEVAGNIFSGPEIPPAFTAGVAAFHDNLNRDMAASFREPRTGDLRLVASATDAVDRGPEPAVVTDDVEAKPRRGRPDLGAAEFDAARGSDGGRAVEAAAPVAARPAGAVLGAEDFRRAFRGVWAPPSSGVKDGFAGSYATHEQARDGRTIYLKGHQGKPARYGVLIPPEPAKTRDPAGVPRAELVEWRSLPAWPNLTDRSGIHQYGLLDSDRGLFVTFKAFYAVGGEDFPSQGLVDRDGKVFGLYRLESPAWKCDHNKVAGYMCRPPSGIDADYLVGLCGTPGSQHSSHGPSLYAVRFDSAVEVGKAQTATPILSYTPKRSPMRDWDNITSVRGAAWIEANGKGAVVFSGHRSMGHVWYGKPEVTAADGKHYVDHHHSSKGYHAEGYAQGLWVYDPADVRDAFHGKRKPDEVQPVEWVDLKDLGATLEGASPKGWVTASYRDGRLIIGIQSGVPGSEGAGIPLMVEFRWP